MTSDYEATHSTVQSADAGMDQEMPAPSTTARRWRRRSQDGQVSMATLNQMVSRILTEMFRFNEFNNPPTGSTSATVTTPAHQAVSQAVAEAGTVLLKNSRGTLPLSADGGGNVAVIGPAASAAPTDTGGGSAYVTSHVQRDPAAGHPGRRGLGHHGQLHPGPAHRHVADADPEHRTLTPAYAPTGYGGTYTGTLTAPETGTYVLAFQNPGCYTVTNLSLDGTGDPGQPRHPAGVHLLGGREPAWPARRTRCSWPAAARRPT